MPFDWGARRRAGKAEYEKYGFWLGRKGEREGEGERERERERVREREGERGKAAKSSTFTNLPFGWDTRRQQERQIKRSMSPMCPLAGAKGASKLKV